jgi:type VI protein secretion system component VasA
MIVTTHVRQMLANAHELATMAEEAVEDAEVERLLDGAAVLARHAAAELDDELHRHRYGEQAYRP